MIERSWVMQVTARGRSRSSINVSLLLISVAGPAQRRWGAELPLTNTTNGTTVHVRRLFFFDAGTYKLVAGRIMAP